MCMRLRVPLWLAGFVFHVMDRRSPKTGCAAHHALTSVPREAGDYGNQRSQKKAGSSH